MFKRLAKALIRLRVAQAGLSICWSHIPHCWKSHVAAHMYLKYFRHLPLIQFLRNHNILRFWCQQIFPACNSTVVTENTKRKDGYFLFWMNTKTITSLLIFWMFLIHEILVSTIRQALDILVLEASASSEGSGESVHKHRLTRAFAAH